MVRKSICIIAMAFSPPVAAQPNEAMFMQTGNHVLEICEMTTPFGQGLCAGYITGIIQRDNLARWMTPGREYVCEFPGGVTNGQKREVIISYLKAHPEKRHADGASLALIALKEAFCRK